MASISERLRKGVETGPLFDPLSSAAYALALFIVIATIALFKLTGFSIGPGLHLPWPLLVFFIAGPLSRRIGHPRLAGTLECFGFLYGQAIFLFTLLPLTALSGPLADSRLAAWDRALGFNWVAFVKFAEPAIPLFQIAYDSFALQALFIVTTLFYMGHKVRAWKLATAALIAVIICSFTYTFFPAESAMMHYGVYPTRNHADVVSGPVIRAIKDGQRVVTWPLVMGLITFPSYHACAAALFAWGGWVIPFARWPILVLNLVMAAACIVVGSHYLVDILGGFSVACVSLLAVSQLGARRSPQPGSGKP